jgi:pimeloyl-ACP methyl ester carboxylesterase
MSKHFFSRTPWLLALLLAITACDDGSDGSLDAPRFLQPAIGRNLPITREQSAGLPDYNIYRPTNIDATGAPVPVIVWANGGCVRYDAVWESLLASWARAGFVTVAPTVPADGDDPRTDLTSVEDQAMAIDWAYAENARDGGPYAGHFDLDRIVAAGNSCGGIVALSLASRDSRVSSVFVLSGSSAIPGSPEEAATAIMGNILVPVGYAVGGPEDIASTYARQDYTLLPVGVPGYLARRSKGDHRTVSTDPDILAEVAEISTNWIDFTLYGNPAVRQKLRENPCASCDRGIWEIDLKNLDLHVVP